MTARGGLYTVGLIPTLDPELISLVRVGQKTSLVLSVGQCSLSGLDTACLFGFYGLSW